MEFYLHLVVALLTGMTALLAHRSAAVVVLLTRMLVVRFFPQLNPESIEIFVGMVMLLAIAIF